MPRVNEVACTVARVAIYPIKSCAGIEPEEALLIETGLDLDRTWMVVDAQGDMLSQRDLPRLALVQPRLRAQDLVLRAPGMLALHLALDAAEAPATVRVWDDELRAWDMGPLAAQWFSDFLGRPARLARLDPEATRGSDPRWTGGRPAEVGFADGFALLVASQASLDELNRRLGEGGTAPVDMRRFRPNLVLDGLPAFDEDFVDQIEIDGPDGPVRLALVKPCVRCSVPDVDPETGVPGVEPGRTLAGFRADARMDGGITFGMNAIPLDGTDRRVRAGSTARARLTV